MLRTRAEKKLCRQVETMLHLCSKVLNYRRDVLPKAVMQHLTTQQSDLKSAFAAWLRKENTETQLHTLYASLDSTLKKHGKGLYPLNFWNENAEILWVAAFLAITLRTFFIQPFRIPTNSMFPSFSGMQTKVYSNTLLPPNPLSKPLRWILKGAENYYFKAPCDGSITIPLFEQKDAMHYNSHVRYEVEYGREIGNMWLTFLLPKPYRVYIFYVHNVIVRVRVPFEFNDMEAVICKKFFPQAKSLSEVLKHQSVVYSNARGFLLETRHQVRQGDCFLHFDIFAGDMLFVDRITYHFRQPKIGEAVVFKTEQIPAIGKEQYYIKRLVGKPGDVLEINEQGQLWLNEKEIDGSLAFRGNNRRLGLYPGYRAYGNLQLGQNLWVPEKYFYVLGDNSPFSYDSRYWGFVPQRSVVGKASFVLHPFSWRWGTAEQDKANPDATASDYVFQ
ncbi:MAG: signal peptidase I [Puniceicoccales bacterium]|jgi:signal peptidase I|nr:signal peptidase I [Puniceicoccales bacterium]